MTVSSLEFKKLFSKVAAASDFVSVHGGWFRESPECVIVLDLQKSNFGNYFELNIKVFVQGFSDARYSRSREMVKGMPGDIFLRPPDRFRPALDLDKPMTSDERARAIETLFREFVSPVTSDARTRAGLISLAERGLVYLLPAVREQLNADPL